MRITLSRGFALRTNHLHPASTLKSRIQVLLQPDRSDNNSMSFFSGLLVCAKLRWFRMWLALGICLIAAVFYFSLTPIAIPAEHFDKLFHALTYALMMGWFVQLYNGRRSHLLLAIGFMSMGVSIEILQGFHPMRYFDVLDTLAKAPFFRTPQTSLVTVC